MWGYVAAYLAGLTTIPAIVLALGALADFDSRPSVSNEEATPGRTDQAA